MSRKISFSVPGEPKPQGSKDQFGRESCKELPAWRSLVSMAAKESMNGNEPTRDAVRVYVSFIFTRPNGHFGKGKNEGVLKSSAPVNKITRPDVDKLLRAVLDAMTGIVFTDDSQVIKVEAAKLFGIVPQAIICVEWEGDK